MLSLTEWIIKNKRKRKRDERPISQSHREVGTKNQQGETDRGDQEIESEGIFVFTEPR